LNNVVAPSDQFATDAPVPRAIISFAAGLNENTTPDIQECSAGFNFDLTLNQTSLIPRKPFDLKGTATNAGELTSIMQLVTRANAQTTLTVNGNQVYLWDGGSTFTSKATVTAPAALRDAYWSLNDELIITDVNLNNVVAKWDGTTYANLTTGLAQPLKAKYVIVHLNRVWLFNITYNSVNYPHMILVSAFENRQNYDISTRGGPTTVGGGVFPTGLEAFYLLVPDLKPINGVTLFQNTLLISTLEGRTWKLTGSSPLDFQFGDFFDTEPAIGSENITDIGNDVLFVGRGGNIQLLSATQTYGDVRSFSLSRWLPNTTANLSTVNRIVYDRLGQRVLLFTPSKVLVLFKNMLKQNRYQASEGLSPWSVYTTQDSASFNTQFAKYMLIPGTTNFSVFFGDSAGRMFDLNGVGSGDAGASQILVSRRTRHIGPEIVQPWPWDTENITGHLRYRRLTPLDFTVSLDWDDEYNTGANVLSLKGPAANDPAPYWNGGFYWNGSSYWNQGFAFASRVSSMNIDPGGKGPGFYLTVSTAANAPFQLDAVEFD